MTRTADGKKNQNDFAVHFVLSFDSARKQIKWRKLISGKVHIERQVPCNSNF